MAAENNIYYLYSVLFPRYTLYEGEKYIFMMTYTWALFSKCPQEDSREQFIITSTNVLISRLTLRAAEIIS